MNSRPKFLIFVAAFFAAGAVNAFAQNTNATPSPTPPMSEPMIISRADDRPVESVFPDANDESIESLRQRVDARIAAEENADRADERYEQRQRRLLLNLDLLTRSEERADALRRQLFDMMQKESEIQTKLDRLEYDLRPESIDRNIAFAGSLRPEELRELRERSLESERANLQALLEQIQRSKQTVQRNLVRAEDLVEKLRTKLEQEIDEAFAEDTEGQ